MSTDNEAIILTVVYYKGYLHLKPNKPIERLIMLGLLSDIQYMFNRSDCKICKPEDTNLPAFVTVDYDALDRLINSYEIEDL